MKLTGKLKEPVIDYATGRLIVQFEPYEDFRQAYEELKGCEKLSFEIKRFRRRRSLDANAYYWVLCTKLAGVLHTSNEEVHNEMPVSYTHLDVYKRQSLTVKIDFIISITPGNLNEKALPPPSNTKIPNMTVQLFTRKSLT